MSTDSAIRSLTKRVGTRKTPAVAVSVTFARAPYLSARGNGPLGFLARSLTQFLQLRAQTMAQRAFQPEFSKQLFRFDKRFIATLAVAEQASPGT